MSKTNKIAISSEIWKTLPEKTYGKNYQVSNYGNVRNKETGKYLKLTLRSGYSSCCFTVNKKSLMRKIHKLVALLFVKNDDPDNKIWVNHINGNKLDNRAVNLEWCTPSQNNKHAFDTGLNHKTTKAVVSYDPHTGSVESYDSILEASESTGINDGYICNALSGKRKHTNGYIGFTKMILPTLLMMLIYRNTNKL